MRSLLHAFTNVITVMWTVGSGYLLFLFGLEEIRKNLWIFLLPQLTGQ
jgi:hypothetical protein